jgi:hypothetical protein
MTMIDVFMFKSRHFSAISVVAICLFINFKTSKSIA